METSNLKNTVILKSIPSNIIEEAIIVLKKNIKVKEYEIKSKNEKSEKGNYIIKEAEMIINNYCNKIENEQKKEKQKKEVEKKYSKAKRWLIISSIIAIIEMIIIIIK